MRFVWGPIPPSRVLNPQAEGWTPLREVGAGRFTALALLVGLPFTLATAFLLVERKDGLRGLFRDDPLPAGLFLVSVLLAIPVHEAIHALAYGEGVRTAHLILGLCTRGKFPYVILDSPRPRWCVLRMLVAPFVALSLLPLLTLPYLPETARGLVLAFCSLHTAMCGGDAVVVWRLITQVPRAALVHNNGWQTYWHVPVGKAAGAAPGTSFGGDRR
jgi:hypothetical protein